MPYEEIFLISFNISLEAIRFFGGTIQLTLFDSILLIPLRYNQFLDFHYMTLYHAQFQYHYDTYSHFNLNVKFTLIFPCCLRESPNL